MKNKKKNSYQKYLKFTNFLQSKALPTSFCFVMFLLLIACGILPESKLTSLIKIDVVCSVGIVTIITWILAVMNRLLIIFLEEKIKLNSNFEDNFKKYNKEKFYTSHNKKYPLIELISTPESITGNITTEYIYKLDPIIVSFMPKLLEAHKTSKFKNKRLYRLDDYKIENNCLQLDVSLSDMYATLITNRAMDYSLGNKLTIREIFEPGPKLNTIKNSKLNNGLGFNFIVKTTDGYFALVKKTGKNATGKFIFNTCSSLLNTHFNEEDDSFMGMLKQLIYNALITDYNYPKIKEDKNYYNIIKEENIQYLGLVRNAVEGGKPELCFIVHIDKSGNELENMFRKTSLATKKDRGNKDIILFKKEDYNILEECNIYFKNVDKKGRSTLISMYILEKIKNM